MFFVDVDEIISEFRKFLEVRKGRHIHPKSIWRIIVRNDEPFSSNQRANLSLPSRYFDLFFDFRFHRFRADSFKVQINKMIQSDNGKDNRCPREQVFCVRSGIFLGEAS